jgi:hypothetical protein
LVRLALVCGITAAAAGDLSLIAPLGGGPVSLVSSLLRAFMGAFIWSGGSNFTIPFETEAYSGPFLVGAILGAVGGGLSIGDRITRWLATEAAHSKPGDNLSLSIDNESVSKG